MASNIVANLQTMITGESKSARKKKAKAEVARPSVEKASSEYSDATGKTNGVDASVDGFIKELQKSMRNINKKLSAMQKVDSIVEANPGVSLEDLLSSRKINADQKAQVERKPQLQAQLAQLDEQVAQYKGFENEYQKKVEQEKEILQRGHSEELEKLKEVLNAEAALEQKKAFREKFLTLSRFLRAAAARRQLEEDDSDLTKAFEGALLLVYGGDASAIAAAEKLIDGAEDSVPSTEGVPLSVTYAQVKQAALDEAPFAAEEAWVDEVAQAQPGAPESEPEPVTAGSTDPTIANATLTEINAGDLALDDSAEATSAPAATSVDTGAANAAAEDQWDKQASGSDDPLAESYEMVPRDPMETETPAVAAPVTSTSSWAEDVQDAVATTEAPANGKDGFSEVSHHRGRGRGGFQSGDRGGRGRGRGDGRGRGRGRGAPRGGGYRGQRGGGESQ